MGKIAQRFSKTFTLALKAYQYFISPFFGNCCRFHPSCSTYAIEAIQVQGSLRGIFLTFKRLAKCHPWHPGGIDLVPERNSKCRPI